MNNFIILSDTPIMNQGVKRLFSDVTHYIDNMPRDTETRKIEAQASRSSKNVVIIVSLTQGVSLQQFNALENTFKSIDMLYIFGNIPFADELNQYCRSIVLFTGRESPEAIKKKVLGTLLRGNHSSELMLTNYENSVSTSNYDVSVLSARQKTVLQHVCNGLSNKEIAQRLHLTEGTVKLHVSAILLKFDLRRRSDLILLNAGGYFSHKNPDDFTTSF